MWADAVNVTSSFPDYAGLAKKQPANRGRFTLFLRFRCWDCRYRGFMGKFYAIQAGLDSRIIWAGGDLAALK